MTSRLPDYFDKSLNIKVTTLKEKGIDQYLKLRSKALKEELFSFGASIEDYEPKSEEIHKFISTKPNAILIAWQESTPIGMLSLKGTFEYTKFPHLIEISQVYVIPEFRDKGIATNLFTFAAEYLQEEFRLRNNKSNSRLDRIKLMLSFIASPNSDKSFNLYKKLGFIEIGKYKDQLLINNNYFDEILMEKTVFVK